MTRSDPNGTRNIIIEKQSWVPSLLKLKQMGARNQSRALQETISFYAKNLSLRGLMHFLLAAIMPRLITPEPGEKERERERESDTHIRIFDPWLLPPI